VKARCSPELVNACREVVEVWRVPPSGFRGSPVPAYREVVAAAEGALARFSQESGSGRHWLRRGTVWLLAEALAMSASAATTAQVSLTLTSTLGF
jgi:hypothetical protein